MHTPRFSGQPAKAGDFVLMRIPSRPIRTSCENVGTVFPLLARPLSSELLQVVILKHRRSCVEAEGSELSSPDLRDPQMRAQIFTPLASRADNRSERTQR